jgi:thiamine-monophosphate kinase
VTGHLGGSAAGLAMLAAGMDPPRWLKDKHLVPRCRLDLSPQIAPVANAMIDISDGLAAEVNHICDQSGTGAEIEVNKIPVHEQTHEAAKRTGKRYLDFALAGGEDFELLFSIAEQNRQFIEDQAIDVVAVGRVTDAPAERMLLFPDGKRVSLIGGYNHFP